MIGDIISIGVGTPSSVEAFILVGLSPNPEVREATIIPLVAVYDASLIAFGRYDASIPVVSTYDASINLIGEG